jgi:hypothetical protein
MKNDVIQGISKREFNARLTLKRLREVYRKPSQRNQNPVDGVKLREHLLMTALR